MTNKELIKKLLDYPLDAVVAVEYCNIADMRYNEDMNLILIE